MNNTYFCIMELPEIPPFKQYYEQHTQEQILIRKIFSGRIIDKAEEDILRQAQKFYRVAFDALKKIDLSRISLNESEIITTYLQKVFNCILIFQNKIRFSDVFRASIIADSFLEDGKVRDVKYLMQPSIDIVKERGLYNRASSNLSTRFYCSFYPAVAVTEVQPKVGDRIIVAQWHNHLNVQFNTYPIAYADVNNLNVEAATRAFEERMQFNHPLIADIFKLWMQFLGSEFVKKVAVSSPYRLEYLYSAFFSDQILSEPILFSENNPDELDQYDALIYPSVAYQHLHENMAIKPSSVEKLTLIGASEILVQKCFWENINTKDIDNDLLPVAGIKLRHLLRLDRSTLIWNDD